MKLWLKTLKKRAAPMTMVGKKHFIRQVITYELVAFAMIISLIWLDELADIPHLLLRAEKTGVNWKEALFETLVITPIACVILHYTEILLNRMKYLEGFLQICASCKKIRDEYGNWQQMESYIHERSEAQFSHGICPQCAKRLYPEVFIESGTPDKTATTSRKDTIAKS